MDQKYFYYLKDISFTTKNWRSLFVDLTKQQSYLDLKCQFLSEETWNFFNNKGLFPVAGIIWSWPYGQNRKLYYHTDLTYVNGVFNGDFVSCNFLLQGDSGLTEFVAPDKTFEVDNDFHAKSINLNYTKYDGSASPDVTAILTEETPLVMRIDIPHRVNTNMISAERCRWSYSLRFTVDNNRATWNQVLDRLGAHVCWN